MVKVKICGITNLEDALVAVDAGCDALGFLFYRKSPRYIAPEKAKRIIESLPPYIIKIGVFVNAKEKTVKRIARFCHLRLLQFHGNESPDFCARFKKYKIIKTFRVKNNVRLQDFLKYKVFAYLFDTFVKSKAGGSGKHFDWKLLGSLCGIRLPVFLSGGLHAKNVQDAIRTAQPDWVDASSLLEKSPGKKDHLKVKEFIKKAKI
jgi:phosphoribosylanthranilate isomerase